MSRRRYEAVREGATLNSVHFSRTNQILKRRHQSLTFVADSPKSILLTPGKERAFTILLFGSQVLYPVSSHQSTMYLLTTHSTALLTRFCHSGDTSTFRITTLLDRLKYFPYLIFSFICPLLLTSWLDLLMKLSAFLAVGIVSRVPSFLWNCVCVESFIVVMVNVEETCRLRNPGWSV